MTATVEALVEGSAIPAPPPPPVPEEAGDDFNPTRGRMLHTIWDKVAIYGPIMDVDLLLKLGALQAGGSWRKYLRHHSGVNPKAYEKDKGILDRAIRWHFDQEVDFGLRNGYLRREHGLLVIGTCPPEHEPFQSIGGEKEIKTVLLRDENTEALKILRAKTNPARRKPYTAIRKAELRKSLETVGQLDPIRMWQPPNMGADPVVINGQTRKDLLEEMGVEPRIEWLPEGTQAVEALLQRIHHEVYASTKTQTKEDRDAYIVDLAAQNVKQVEIAKQVGASQATVSRVVSAVIHPEYRRQAPTEDEVKTWYEHHEGGWSYRDIAEFVTGWGKDTIRKYVEAYRDGLNASDVKEVEEQAEADAIVQKLSPTSRATTPEGRKRQAAKVKPLVEEAEKRNVSVTKTIDVANNTGAAAAAVAVSPDLTRQVVKDLIARFGENKPLGQVLAELP